MRIKSLSGRASLFSLHMLSERCCLVTVTVETALLSASLILSFFQVSFVCRASVETSSQQFAFESELDLIVLFDCETHLLCRNQSVVSET